MSNLSTNVDNYLYLFYSVSKPVGIQYYDTRRNNFCQQNICRTEKSYPNKFKRKISCGLQTFYEINN